MAEIVGRHLQDHVVEKMVASFMGMCSSFRWLAVGETDCHPLRQLCGEIQMEETTGQLWPTVSEEQRSVRVSLKADPPPVEPSDKTTASVMF